MTLRLVSSFVLGLLFISCLSGCTTELLCALPVAEAEACPAAGLHPGSEGISCAVIIFGSLLSSPQEEAPLSVC